MSAIMEALQRLDGSLQNLENTVTGFEHTVAQELAGQQRDMFGSPIAAPSNENKKIDASIVAKRLDIAIEKVEEILSEAASA
ncbi:MAG: hypothetical protein ACRBCT_06180 [Alphaproteobacteria bacterium]